MDTHTCKDRRVARVVDATMRELRKRMSRTDAARVANLDPAYFSKRFRKAMGVSFATWSTTIRLQEARRLLSETDLRVCEIVMAVGYEDVTTFERNFRRFLGASPRAYRARAAMHSVGSEWKTPNAERTTRDADNTTRDAERETLPSA